MSDSIVATVVTGLPAIIASIGALVVAIRTRTEQKSEKQEREADVKSLSTRMDACEKCEEERGTKYDDVTLFHEHMAAVHMKLSMKKRTPDDMPARSNGDTR